MKNEEGRMLSNKDSGGCSSAFSRLTFSLKSAISEKQSKEHRQ